MVVESGQFYRSLSTRTSGAAWDLAEQAEWEALADPSITLFPDWQATTFYREDQVVVVSAVSYRSLSDRVSGTIFNDIERAEWELLSDPGTLVTLIPDWTSGTPYLTDQVVIESSTLYRSLSDRTSGGNFDPAEQANWEEIGGGISAVVVPDWAADTDYLENELTVQSDLLYRSDSTRTSGPVWDPTEEAEWTLIGAAEAVIPDWQAATNYVINQVVVESEILYRSLSTRTSGATFDPAEAAEWLQLTQTGDTYDFTPQVAAPANQRGRVFYDDATDTLAYYNDSTNVTLNIGQELLFKVRNNTGAAITNGQVVRIIGSFGGFPSVDLAIATSKQNANVAGVATEDIADGTEGYITQIGFVNNLDTNAFTQGDLLYVSDTVAGGLTATRPPFAAPVAIVTVSSPTTGQMLVRGEQSDDVAYRAITNSGVLSGGLMSQATATTFDIADGDGVIVNSHADPFEPVIQPVSWTGLNGVAVANIATQGSTHVYIDSTGSVVQREFRTSTDERNLIYLGVILHPGGTDIDGITNSPSIAVAIGNNLKDVELLQGSRFLSGGVWSAAANDLTTELSAGTLYSAGVDWHDNAISPNEYDLAAVSPITFSYVKQDGVITAAGQANMDPTQFDNGGTLQPVGGSGNDSTVQYLFLFPGSDIFYVLYGQQTYTNQPTAIANLQQDFATAIIPDFLMQQAVMCGAIVMERTANDLSDDSDATFFSWQIFGTGGAGSGGSPGVVLAENVVYDNSTSGLIATDAQAAIDESLLKSLIPNWAATTDYLQDECVVFGGHVYRANTAFTSGATFDPVNWNKLTTAMRWRNQWVPGTYQPDDVVYDNGWTMVANTETDDRPAPQSNGIVSWASGLGDNPAWPNADDETSSNVLVGQRYTYTDGEGWVATVRAWIPDVSGDVSYSMAVVLDPLGVNPTIRIVFSDFVPANTGWIELGIPLVLIQGNTQFDVILSHSSRDTPTQFNGDWDYKQSGGSPGSGEINHLSGGGEMRVHYEDDNGVDYETQLRNMSVGALIVIGGTTWEVVSTNFQGSHARFGVVPQIRISENTYNVQFTYYAPAIIDYVAENDRNIGNPIIDGLFSTTGYTNAVPTDENQYGVDIRVSGAIISDDWDLLASSEAATGGGGGGSDQASGIAYDNANSDLGAANVQDAIDELDITANTEYLGEHDASGGALPANGTNEGQYYSIIVAGTLTVIDRVGGTPTATAVAVGDVLYYTGTAGSFIHRVGNAKAPAVALDYDNATSGLAATDVQSALDEISGTIPPGGGEANTASNLPGDEGVFFQKAGVDLEFKSLTAGTNITLTATNDEIEIAAAAGAGEANTASNQGAGEGVFAQKVLEDVQFKSLIAGANIDLSSTADEITIAVTGITVVTQLSELTDVDDALAPTDTQILRYSIANNWFESVDNDADIVNYDNVTSGLTATDVQAAIDEVVTTIPPVAPVDSVFTRTGTVVAEAGDYDADQVDYDNVTSGLTATDVKAAIDELALATSPDSSSYEVVTANITLTVANARIIFCDASGGAFTVTLPTVASATTPTDTFVYVIKRNDNSTNNVTITGQGGETIDGQTDVILSGVDYPSIEIASDGTNWFTLAS